MTRHLAPGDYVLSVHNYGPVNHELIVVRATQPDLPLRSDGYTVDEESMQHDEVGAPVGRRRHHPAVVHPP